MSQPGDHQTGVSGAGPAVMITSDVMVATVIVLFALVFFFVFLYLYGSHFWGRNPILGRSRFVFAADHEPIPRRGLDTAVLESLPVTIFRSADFKEELECAVCLSELSDGEEARLLPKCRHGFHLKCIDMWFHSHSTCPLCRSPVEPAPPANTDSGVGSMEILPREVVSGDGYSSESPVLPTNVLFWGTQDQVSTGGLKAETGSQGGPSSSMSTGSSSGKQEGMLVIEIPRRVVEGLPSPMKSPASARLRSLRRLWSQGKRTVGSSCSPRGGDIEQGLAGGGGATGEGSALTPKTPSEQFPQLAIAKH